MLGDMLWLPVEQITIPPSTGLFYVYVDCWWAADKDGNLAVFKSWAGKSLHPQCNEDKELTILIASRTCKSRFDHVVQLPYGFIKDTYVW